MALIPDDPTTGAIEPIVRQKLSDQVFDRLWAMSASGELSVGDAIPSERVLMERFGVGRPAVREAMQALAGKGIITISQGERSRVNAPNAAMALDQVDQLAKLLLSSGPGNLAHLKQVRKILETGTVALVAKSCSAVDAQRLRDLIVKQRAQLDDPQAFIRGDIEFHVAIASLTENPLLHNVTRAMLTWLQEYYTPMLHWSGREGTTLMEHAKLVDYLEAGNETAAADLMAEHLDRSDPLFSSKTG
jgi:DNA-binding FadR family transcriptional regulator